jgi:hypothetical protein
MRYTANQRYSFNLSDKYVKEESFWNEWAETVNETAKNVPMGLSSIFRQVFQSMIITGMAEPDVNWENVRIDGKMYTVPTKITLLPILATKLLTGKVFGDEEIWLSIDEESETATRESTSEDQKYSIRYAGDSDSTDYKKRKPGIIKPNAEAIKFNWTPNNMTMYPVPILKRAFVSIALRHKFLEADMSLLDGIIERIIQIKVGDKDTELFADDENGEGDLTMASKMFQENLITQMVVTPYYYDIKVIQPDTALLLKADKYIQTSANIMNAFGIILDPSNTTNVTNEEKINTVMFKEYVRELQEHVASYMTKLCREIVRRNPKLKGNPKFTFDKPDFEDTGFKSQLVSLYNYGLLDAYSILEKFGFNPDNIIERLKKQQRVEKEDEIFTVRATFKQEAQRVGGDTVQSDKKDTGGRPTKSQENTNNLLNNKIKGE